MSFFSKFFSKSPEDLLTKGDRCLDAERFFDARTFYEDGLKNCSDEALTGITKEVFKERIDRANLKLAELNLCEAESAFSRGDSGKAIDHLELVKTLTYDACIREKAEKLLKYFTDSGSNAVEPATSLSCTSCSHTKADDCDGSSSVDDSLHPLEYFELLIRQLPEELYQRYSNLGEDFAYAYVAACQDNHAEALSLFDKWSGSLNRDIYYCERGKVLHRLGNQLEAEQHLRESIILNRANSLSWLNLALLLIEGSRFEEALQVLQEMISENLMAEQAMLLRGEILESAGNLNEAVEQYSSLLETQYARSAAEKLYGVLVKVGRLGDAELIFKQFLGKCSH